MKPLITTIALLTGLIVSGCDSPQPAKPANSLQQPQQAAAPTTDVARQTIETAANEAKQQQMAHVIVSALRRQGVSANARVISGELVINSEMANNHDQREILASSIFSKRVQQQFCDVGVRKVIIAGGGLFSSQDVYDMTCKAPPEGKLDADEQKAKKAMAEAFRHDYIHQLSSDLKDSNIQTVSSAGSELQFTAKPGMQKAQMLEGVRLMARSDIGSSWCGIGFRQVRLHMTSTDGGTIFPLNCRK